MNLIVKFLFIIFFIFVASCSKDDKKITIIEEKEIQLQMIDAYKEGVEALEDGDVLFAAQKFNEAEILFPQSIWAPKSTLMAAYAYYSQDYYDDAIYELERFIEVYTKDKRMPYARFLLAMCYYEEIVDEKKDLGPLLKAQDQFKFIIKTYPDSDFALDAKFKLNLINDILASKEIYYRIGLTDESKKYANLLGYNYQSSKWYAESYTIFNKGYESSIKKTNKKKGNFIIRKFKALFE